MCEGLGDSGRREAGGAHGTLRQSVELGGVGTVIIAVEVEVEDTAGARDGARACHSDRAFVGGVDIAVSV
ncbi:MAG: hypothetical protein AABZ47_18760, partial [Planctomycetota bacterium]